MNINGKTALITGGAHRVGRAITLGLAQKGANVVINFNTSAEPANQTAAEARSMGVGSLAVQCDVSSYDQVNGMVASAVEQFGGVDILVNSASWFQKTPFPMEDFSDWFKVIDILIHGSMYCANALAPMMKERGEGAIINIVDRSAWHPFRGFAAHSVGKNGLLAFTRQLAIELAPEVKVNAVSPGPVLPPPGYTDEQAKRVAQGTLLKRWGTPEDVACAVLFLIESEYITGEVITVDGGEQIAS
jgi:NAD(P)-dependent dehydrogenase (short-subunit alcohol dehydrogenase family)